MKDGYGALAEMIDSEMLNNDVIRHIIIIVCLFSEAQYTAR